jgi:hypothetical protein
MDALALARRYGRFVEYSVFTALIGGFLPL